MLLDEREVVAAFYVDVNSATESGQVGTTTASVVDGMEVDPAAVDVGMYVLAVDVDENACIALVTARGDGWLQLHMDETTWTPLSHVLNAGGRVYPAAGSGATFRAFAERLLAVPKSEIDAERTRERGDRPAPG